MYQRSANVDTTLPQRDCASWVSPKTVKQCKKKIRNLKQAYKDAKANNKGTGNSPKTSPFFDTFDDILGTRAMVTMPGVIQSDSDPFEASNDSGEASDDCETDSSGTPSPDQRIDFEDENG